jgi:hypothetical protein
MQKFQDWNVNIHGKRIVNGVNIFETSIKPLPNNEQQYFIVTFVNTPPTLVVSNIKVKRKHKFFFPFIESTYHGQQIINDFF